MDSLVKEWRELILKNSVDEAKKFYWKNMHSLVEKRFVNLVNEKIKAGLVPKYDWLIIPAGLEDYYYVLLINALKPKNIYFLCTHEFKNSFLDMIIKKTKIRSDQYIVNTVAYKGMDVAEVYGKIKENINLFNGKVAVDLTRGKRIVSAGSAIMASFFGFDLFYIDEDWMDDIKRGIPGTEELVQVGNPFHIFGDLKKSFAIELFNHYNFNSATFFFKELCSKVKDPRECEILALLSEAYYQWDGFNYRAAYAKLQGAINKIGQFQFKLLDINQLKKNFEALEILSNLQKLGNMESSLKDNNLVANLLIDLYTNSSRRRETGRFEDAVSRLYRLLELIAQYRLFEYNIVTSRPNYNHLPDLEEKYKQITEKLYSEKRGLPVEIGIKDGHILLFILSDRSWEAKTFEDLKNFLGPIRLRDDSIIAHGISVVGDKGLRSIEAICKEFISRMCTLLNVDLGNLIEQHTFLKL